DRVGVAAEHRDGRPLGRVAEAAEARDEIGVPLGAAELAVGGRAQPGRLLHRDGVPDRIVLGLGELVRGDGPSPAVGAGAEQRGRAEQAPDVVGAKRRCGTEGHGLSSVQNRLSGRPKWTRASSPAVARYWEAMCPWYMATSR